GGTSLRCTIGSWQASLSAIESACPRTIAASVPLSFRGDSGRRALPPTIPGRSAAKATSSSGLRAIARRHPLTARLNGSVGESFDGFLGLMFDDIIASRISETAQLSATLTDDSGNSTPKQR